MYGASLESGIPHPLSTTLLSGILIESHDRVGYFNRRRLPAGISEAVKYPGWCRRVIVLDRRWLGLAGFFDPSQTFQVAKITGEA